jgi:RsiW-degrading membrane proteinase PrsW (M82 family)
MLYQAITILIDTPITNLLLAFLLGILPVFIWLWLLEHEDKHPEPKKLIFLAFLAGMISVFFVIPLEEYAAKLQLISGVTILLWAVLEECVKFLAAYITTLRRIENDEPIDSSMYLVATALGFSAVENIFFVLQPIASGNIAQAVVTGDFRFIGATLLHIVASGTIGVTIGFSFYKKRTSRIIWTFLGLLLAIVLHALFNLLIISNEGQQAIFSFYAIWLAFIAIILVFEKITNIKQS